MSTVGLLSGIADALVERAAGMVRAAADHVARAGEARRLWRALGDVNARLAAMEAHGPVTGMCRVCAGPLHLIVRGVGITGEGGAVVLLRDVHRCARCWALRPVDRSTGEATGAGGGA